MYPRTRCQGGRSVLFVAQQPEDDPQFFLGRSADGLDGLQCGAGLLRALGHEALVQPGLDGDHREGVGHDVVQFTGDAHPLLPDLLAGAFGLGGSRLLGLRGQPGQVASARRDDVADEPACHQRQEAFHGPGGGGRVPGRERRVHERSAESRGAGRGGGDRHASWQARGGEVRREPEHDAERQRGVARGHDHRVSEGRRRQHRQWPAPQRRDQAAHHEREEKALAPVMRVRSVPDTASVISAAHTASTELWPANGTGRMLRAEVHATGPRPNDP